MLSLGLRSILALILAQAGCSRFGFNARRGDGLDGSRPVPRDATRRSDGQARDAGPAHQLASDAMAPARPDLGRRDAGSDARLATTYLRVLEDANVAAGSPDQVRGDEAVLTPGFCTSPANGNMRSWLKFDLSSLPAGVTILEARVGLLFVAHWGTQDYELHRSARDDWTERALTWNNQPAYDPEVLATIAAFSEDNVWKSLDVTGAAAREFAGDKRLTLVLTGATLFDPLTTPDHHENYANSKESEGMDLHPTLSIVYTRVGP